MKVLYFHQHFVTPKGPGGVRSYMMARRLVEQGHAVTMVCGSAHGADTGLSGPFARGMRRGRVDGIEVIELDLGYSNRDGFLKRSMTFLRFAFRSMWIALREPCDLVFATTTPLTAALPGLAARWVRRKPFVFEVRDLWPELPRAMGVIRNPVVLWALGALEWVSYRSADAVIGLSPGIVEGIKARGTDPARIHLVPNGCDLEIFASPEEPWRPPEVAPTDLMCLFAGAHGMANGLDAVLDAAAVLKSRGRTDVKFVFAGDGKLKARLQARAAAEGLDNVVFMAPVSKRRLAGLMAAADLGLQILADVPAFYYGTSPNKFFDYLAAGLPVLTNYPGWVADLVTQNRCGFAVPPRDAVAFAGALEQAAADKTALASMGERAQALGATQFHRQLLADRWIDAVVSALPPAARPVPASSSQSTP